MLGSELFVLVVDALSLEAAFCWLFELFMKGL